jgi:hypothetical protein
VRAIQVRFVTDKNEAGADILVVENYSQAIGSLVSSLSDTPELLRSIVECVPFLSPFPKLKFFIPNPFCHA